MAINVLKNNVPGFLSNGLTLDVVSGQGATYTLSPGQSGSNVLFDRAAGIIYTLPAPSVGLTYTFITTVTATSNNHTVITDAATTFIGGSLVNVKTDLTTLFVIANGTSHVKVQSNGTTTGGIIGSQYTLTCVSSTVWNLDGFVLGSGTIATPMA